MRVRPRGSNASHELLLSPRLMPSFSDACSSRYCPAGSYCLSGATAPTLCQKGSFQDSARQTACDLCAKDEICPEGATMKIRTPCEAGDYWVADSSNSSTSANASDTGGRCVRCPAGHECNGAQKEPCKPGSTGPRIPAPDQQLCATCEVRATAAAIEARRKLFHAMRALTPPLGDVRLESTCRFEPARPLAVAIALPARTANKGRSLPRPAHAGRTAHRRGWAARPRVNCAHPATPARAAARRQPRASRGRMRSSQARGRAPSARYRREEPNPRLARAL